MSKESVVTFLGTIKQINTYFYERKIKLNRPQILIIRLICGEQTQRLVKGRGIRIDKMRFLCFGSGPVFW